MVIVPACYRLHRLAKFIPWNLVSGLHKRLKIRALDRKSKPNLYDLLPDSEVKAGLLVVQGGVCPAAGGEEQGADGGGGAGEHLHGSSNPEPEPLIPAQVLKEGVERLRFLFKEDRVEQIMLDIEIHYYVKRLEVQLLSTKFVCRKEKEGFECRL
jgi:hypothetical protein